VVLKAILGIRVSEEEELLGLDIGEHGMEAYAGFVKEASGPAAGSTAMEGDIIASRGTGY
jgi:ammonium transporter